MKILANASYRIVNEPGLDQEQASIRMSFHPATRPVTDCLSSLFSQLRAERERIQVIPSQRE